MFSQKPDWLKIKVSGRAEYGTISEVLKRMSLNTVCEQAGCPNISECYCNGTATFLILGKACTRNCTFCQVQKDRPQEVDPLEPGHIAQAVQELRIKHVVITSVTRDDLPDGGAYHFAKTIEAVKALCPEVTIEVLIPDFQGNSVSLSTVVSVKPDILNHNIETVERLYPQVRPMADYNRSLELIKRVKTVEHEMITKSGLMVGLGETANEVIKTMQDLRLSGCDFLTIGQYLAPSKLHHPVVKYVHPDIFEEYKAAAVEMGFCYVAAGPFVRSSYHANDALVNIRDSHTDQI